MPLIRHNQKLYAFMHIPKCGGQSIERVLAEQFGEMALINNSHRATLPHLRWTRTSPQHMTWAQLSAHVPPGWFEDVFAMVRHPVSRIASVYHHQAWRRNMLPANLGFKRWFDRVTARQKRNPFILDQHLRPQSDFVPEHGRVFKLERGLDPLLEYFESITGNSCSQQEGIHENKSISDTPFREEQPFTRGMLEKIQRIYGEDFERFGYPLEPPKPCIVRVPTTARRRGFNRSAAKRLATAGQSVIFATVAPILMPDD